ncbi:MAG: MCE family protein [Mycolicibacterium fortuitum]|uniref:MCE family protein n=1 Tax=Mycolicibacterium fortuitum TaxID=1766 RepID=UPI0022BA2DDF|nr:MCE family protein [Mycolicibacterium fortuitum]WAY19731.1 MCE family protein [Mycolicibacterium fortuitum]
MTIMPGETRMRPGWWTLIFVLTVALVCWLVGRFFTGAFQSYVPVTLTSDRSGLVMEPGGKVKLRGVQVGKVGTVTGGEQPVKLKLEIDPQQIKHIPANVRARIAATTVFGSKYIELVYPSEPSPDVLSAGATLTTENVTTEVNTVFENLVEVIHEVDPAKLNAILSAIAEGLRGQGERIGQATTGTNEVLLALNERSDTIRETWRSLKGFSDTYAAAADDILKVLSAVSVTSATISGHAEHLEALLLNVAGFAGSGITLLGGSKDDLIRSVNTLEPTTNLLMKYNPSYTCTLVGATKLLNEYGYFDITGGSDGRSLLVDAALLLGDDPYRYPENLPINGAKGGPGGKPGCGSLPDAAKDFPVRALITNTGWGTGVDYRPNPGIGFPGWANYFPVTKAVPEAPRIRYPGPPAPGPIPYPGAPPYGAPQYGPDGAPLFVGVPPAPPPAGPPPG